MEESALDLDSLTAMLLKMARQMDQETLDELSCLVESDRLGEVILEAIGTSKDKMDPDEQETFTWLLKTVLKLIKDQKMTQK